MRPLTAFVLLLLLGGCGGHPAAPPAPTATAAATPWTISDPYTRSVCSRLQHAQDLREEDPSDFRIKTEEFLATDDAKHSEFAEVRELGELLDHEGLDTWCGNHRVELGPIKP